MLLKRYIKRLTGAVSGELGSRNNPICCDDPSGQKYYLGRLRDSAGARAIFKRSGSVGKGPYGKMLDSYGIAATGIPAREIFMDMYHPGYVELNAIPGYHICNVGAGKIKATLSGDAATLRQLLKFAYSTKDCEQLITFAAALIAMSYGNDREKVVPAVVRNASLNATREVADTTYSFITGEPAV